MKESILCMGTWQLEKSFNKVDLDEDCIELLNFAYDNGVQWFDTALAYDWGRVERVISQSRAIKANIITKLPAETYPPKESGPGFSNFYSRNWILRVI